ncbi:MAG TPA: NUDIX hydrolase [Bacilli bacterium]|jgi:ADP-ribose pyrophosphatase|nr:NUDIX hydrolase [Acholeplasmataceae bacterium]HNZ77881.1 NUDIX hydrolase [Bacilli bacterium]HOD60976.1 NUDIX hydrolase [Bacilli bacterium]HOH62022.1 NUDIX hydrolase [Bacilli bacterium]HPB49001.1 NUDIX hydrolase [Bacilli bacterium]
MIEKKIKSRIIYQGKVIHVKCDDVVLENGIKTKREIVEHRGGVCCLVKTKENKILFVSQFRYALAEDVLELPAGKREAGEDPLTTIKRELKEEVGIIADEIIECGYIYPTPGYSSEKIYLYYVEEYREGEQEFDSDENLILHEIPIKQAYEMINDGRIKDAKTICLLMKCQNKLM